MEGGLLGICGREQKVSILAEFSVWRAGVKEILSTPSPLKKLK
jgi:hypothetical protein